MARPRTGDKPKLIRDATVAEVAAVGSTAVSVNKIAARANLSVGTLYRYYSTKNELLFAVYAQIKRDMHAAMMVAAAAHNGSEKRLHAMWFAFVEHGLEASREFQLAEMMAAEDRSELPGNAALETLQAEIHAEIQAGIDEKVLVDAPVQAIEALLASSAITMIRRATLNGVKPAQADIEQIFRLIWRGIAL